MRQAFILTVAAGFVGVVWTLLRQPAGRVPWMVTAYFVSHAIFVLGIYWASGRAEGNTRAYFETYRILSFFPVLFACGLSVRFALEHHSLGMATGAAVTFAMAAYAYQLAIDAKVFLRMHTLPPAVSWNFMLAWGFTVFAAIALFSLSRTEGDIETQIRFALAGFWAVFGLWHFAFVLGKLNKNLGWITRQDWIPTFAILVCCLWLTYKLSTSQRELGHQALPEIEFRERVAVAPEFDMAARSREVAK